MQTLSLTASKKIADLGVEVVAEKWWAGPCIAFNQFHITIGRTCEGCISNYPAPNLQELLTALPEIGEKLGWTDNGLTSDAGAFAHKLTEDYLYGGMKAVSEEVETLLT